MVPTLGSIGRGDPRAFASDCSYCDNERIRVVGRALHRPTSSRREPRSDGRASNSLSAELNEDGTLYVPGVVRDDKGRHREETIDTPGMLA